MKRSKKNSDEERSRKKKKPKSGKRRLRESSSPSPSYSDDSEDAGSRSHRRSKKQERRRKGSARPDRKKSRKAAAKASSRRGVSVDSSSSGSPVSRGVSERRRRPWPRSPSVRSDRRGKLKVRSRSRGRGTARSRRRMGRSCSSCERSRSSSRPRGRSAVRNPSLRKENYKEIEQFSLLQPETAETKEQKVVREKIDAVNYDRAQMSKLYDEIQSSQNDATGHRYEHRYHEEGHAFANKRGKHPVIRSHTITKNITEKKSENMNNVRHTEDEDDMKLQLRKWALENLRKFPGGPSGNTRLSVDVKKVYGDTQRQDDSPEVLEATQRALSSFRKSSHPPLPDTGTIAIRVKKSSHTYHHDSKSETLDVHDTDKSLDCKSDASLDHRGVQLEHQQKPRLRSIVHVPADRVTINQKISIQNNGDNSGAINTSCQDKADDDQTTLNKGNTREESTNKKADSEMNSLKKEKQHETAFEVVESGTTHDDEVNKAGDELTSRHSTVNKESGNDCQKVDSGSQFQEKTFSRMRDGELVQVSYKVYIPQKTPTLARRKLQR